MSDILLNQGASAKRPANRWLWLGGGVVVAAAVWGFMTLTSRPKNVDAEPSQTVSIPAPPKPAPPVTTTAISPPPSPSIPPTPAAAPAAVAHVSPPTPASAPSASLMAEALQLKSQDQYQAAREKLEAFLAGGANPQAEELLGEVNMTLLTTPREMPEKIDYTVQPGDSLDKIAHKYGTSIGLLMKENNLTRSMVRINERLRVFTGKFTIMVDKSDNTLTLFLNDKFFKRYHVGTGQYNKTPVGQFSVTDKIAQPTWWRSDGKAIPYGDPENLLGTHWLALDIPGYGIHGTWDTNTIGKQSSAGCIRLVNPDIEELFTVVPVGTKVTIQD